MSFVQRMLKSARCKFMFNVRFEEHDFHKVASYLVSRFDSIQLRFFCHHSDNT